MNILQQKIHAYLFMRPDGVRFSDLASVFGIDLEKVHQELEELTGFLQDSGLVILQNDKEVSMVVNPEISEALESLVKKEETGSLSKSALETLTVVLHGQGVSKQEIDLVRGVNSATMLRTLRRRGLIDKENDKDKGVVYKPTLDLLRFLGITNISELDGYKSLSRLLVSLSASEDHDV